MLLIIGKIHLAKMGQDLKIVLSFAFRLFQENFLNVYLISIHYLSSFWTQDDRIIRMMSDHIVKDAEFFIVCTLCFLNMKYDLNGSHI